MINGVLCLCIMENVNCSVSSLPFTLLFHLCRGGVNITINGVGFKTVQEALLIATLIADPTRSDSVVSLSFW